jgi:hypothetical protein
LRRGIWKGLKGEIPAGGHTLPISGVGARLLWKNAQKKDRKNNTSDTINNTIPHRRPVTTIEVWSPCIVLSRATSRHQAYVVRVVRAKLVNNSAGENR